MKTLAALLLAPALVLSAAPRPKTGPVRTAKEARAIAEQETGGQAVRARKITLNGASAGWEVEVRMSGEDRGWRCIVDADSRSVFTKTRIPNPEARKKR
ncbi:MAG TPA: hypothetical protein PLC09_06855 [Holophaga sp.]|nr:hypothetical protein [Holophaga sp.]